jgi:hypothetical protein
VNQFVEECRSEWRRLGVPDPVANEMAADLTADLEEAEAEGGSAEDVLGNSAFDPRRFAASWAAARGVTAPATPDYPYRRRQAPLAIALTTLMGILTIGGLVLLIAYRGRSVAFAVRQAVAAPGPLRFFGPGPNRLIAPGPLGPIRVGPASSLFFGGVDTHPLAWIMLIVGVVGLGLAVLYWSPWSGGHHRNRQRKGPPTPGWN